LKVRIEATQKEFDAKRKALGELLSKSSSEVKFTTPRRGRFKAQQEMLKYYDDEFKKLLVAIKADIDEIIKQN